MPLRCGPRPAGDPGAALGLRLADVCDRRDRCRGAQARFPARASSGLAQQRCRPLTLKRPGQRPPCTADVGARRSARHKCVGVDEAQVHARRSRCAQGLRPVGPVRSTVPLRGHRAAAAQRAVRGKKLTRPPDSCPLTATFSSAVCSVGSVIRASLLRKLPVKAVRVGGPERRRSKASEPNTLRGARVRLASDRGSRAGRPQVGRGGVGGDRAGDVGGDARRAGDGRDNAPGGILPRAARRVEACRDRPAERVGEEAQIGQPRIENRTMAPSLFDAARAREARLAALQRQLAQGSGRSRRAVPRGSAAFRPRRVAAAPPRRCEGRFPCRAGRCRRRPTRVRPRRSGLADSRPASGCPVARAKRARSPASAARSVARSSRPSSRSSAAVPVRARSPARTTRSSRVTGPPVRQPRSAESCALEPNASCSAGS